MEHHINIGTSLVWKQKLRTKLVFLKVEGPTWSLEQSWRIKVVILPKENKGQSSFNRAWNLQADLLLGKQDKHTKQTKINIANCLTTTTKQFQYFRHVYWSNQGQPWGRTGRAATPGPKSQEPPSQMCMYQRGLLKTTAHHPAWIAQPNLCDWSHLINQSATSSTHSPPLPSSRNACHAWSAASCSHFHIDFFSSGPA